MDWALCLVFVFFMVHIPLCTGFLSRFVLHTAFRAAMKVTVKAFLPAGQAHYLAGDVVHGAAVFELPRTTVFKTMTAHLETIVRGKVTHTRAQTLSLSLSLSLSPA
jgi:hypothetical protein